LEVYHGSSIPRASQKSTQTTPFGIKNPMAGRKTMISLHAGEVLSRILYPTNSLATKAYFINLLQEYLLAILYYDYQKLKPNYYVKHHETITFMSNFKHESGQSRSIEDITHSCPIQKSEPAQKDVSSNHLLSATSKNQFTTHKGRPRRKMHLACKMG
jgi:hypothetical protein